MKLIGKLFLLFTISSFIEIFLLVQLTRYTNIWTTIALTLISGSLGAYLAKREGTRALKQIRAAMRMEQELSTAVLDGAMFLVAASFLIAPGVLTDIVGLLLLIPAVRRPVGLYLKRRLMKSIDDKLNGGILQFFSGTVGSNISDNPYVRKEPNRIFSKQPKSSGPVIDIDAER